MSTTHNPSNFNPADYRVLDYIDNQPPQYQLGMPVDFFRRQMEEWRANIFRLVGENRSAIYRCAHCGNGNVRYMTVVKHAPTNETVCFGCDCTNRLDLADRDTFKEQRLKERAAGGRERLRVMEERRAFIRNTPGLWRVLAQATKPLHRDNSFVQDVIRKLDQYGSLSPRQVECIRDSLARDVQRAQERAERAKTPAAHAPSGRVEVQGTILSIKRYENAFVYRGDPTYKMLVQLESGARVFGTMPSAYDFDRGHKVRFKATFAPKADDPSFAFFSRPKVVEDPVTGESVLAGVA